MRTLVILSGMTFEAKIVVEGKSVLQLVIADFREREDRCSSVTESKGCLGVFCVSEDSFGIVEVGFCVSGCTGSIRRILTVGFTEL